MNSNLLCQKIVSNTQCLETVYQNEIWMCFPPCILQKLVHFHRGGIIFSYEDCWYMALLRIGKR
jgi:hypothetical protein